ncbi:bifunctional 4-hydroxy-3-methylbut-2-enyl diphosphate reductase/30S ribosomal protein S1 [Ruminococcaceae bacterium OttesenSCG-928-A16]|nr:bifunctional 4-hydroxy-3-methylbut-2-enyl diphosphate reductase/30S ribosomal protein S1 [Ruminococcaceae bacterium OttesenSCG-928-A16]
MKNKTQNRMLEINGVQVEVASTAGFCFGVARAMQLTQTLLKEGKQVATLGPLIHNPQVIQTLEKAGVTTAGSVEEIPENAVAVVRSHGVPLATYQQLQQKGLVVADATCPFVTKIQKIAEEYGEKGGTVLVAGDATHPEVQGIAGHTAGPVFVFKNLAELREVLPKIDTEKPVAMVAQTTYEVTKWLESVSFIKKECTNCAIFDTICNATWARQQEAEEMARRCDLVIVVGGYGSSNTKKLYNVAAAHTRAVQVETAAELTKAMFNGVRRVGITAGASTPAPVIEEVLNRMSDEIRDGEISFEEMLNDSMKPVHAGQVVKGVVVEVSPSEITVDIGTKQTGIVKLEELTDDPAVRSADELVKRDEEIELVVVKVNDQDGIIYLSKRQMEARKGAEEVAKAAEEGTVMDGYVIESNKGGLVALVKGVKVFIPASQATVRRGEDYTTLVRKHVQLKIKEFSPRRTIGSIREVMAAELDAQREAFWAEVEVGKHYVGAVKSLTSYGAFVDIGGVDGLVHISELSWSRIKHPSEIVNVGDTIEVYVKDLDRDNHKVSLGFKKQEDNPWEKLRGEYPIGSNFTATVVSVTQFGAFVRILPGIDGLVHISEISYDRVERVADVLSVGQEVEVKLLDVDFDRKRISLSMKALLPVPEETVKSGDDEMVASSSAEETVVTPEIEAEMEASAPAVEVVSEEVTEEAPVEEAAEEAPAEEAAEEAPAEEVAEEAPVEEAAAEEAPAEEAEEK